MKTLVQCATDHVFVQDPYPFYDVARAQGDLVFWQDYDRICATSYDAVNTVLRDRRWGREIAPEFAKPTPAHIQPFMDVEANSMLELDPPRHTRLRGLVMRAFTSRRIAALATDIEALANELIDRFEGSHVNLLTAYAEPIPVLIIARLLGVPDDMAPQLLDWSHRMVAMYQAGRTRDDEDAAVAATTDFSNYLNDLIAFKRSNPSDDLLSELIKVEEEGEKLSLPELISTTILLLNAGHEATVHSIGNSVKTLIEHETTDITDTCVEELLRFDPPLHLFERHAKEDIELAGHSFKRGDTIALLLASANRDEAAYPQAHQFRPNRPLKPHQSFGAGIHFCVGAPLARLEMAIALRTLFQRHPKIALSQTPTYANRYHFHGLERLDISL